MFVCCRSAEDRWNIFVHMIFMAQLPHRNDRVIVFF